MRIDTERLLRERTNATRKIAISFGVSSAASIDEISRQITERGNDVEIRRGKDGIKVYEVSKRLVCNISSE